MLGIRKHGKSGRVVLSSRTASTSIAGNKLFGKITLRSTNSDFLAYKVSALTDAQAPYTYKEVFERSIRNPEEFWAEEASKITWMKKWDHVLDISKQPFTKW